MGKYDSFYEARKTITEILRDDLIGPVTSEEVLSEFPSQYYLMGKLYPQQTEDKGEDISRSPVLETETEVYDASVSMSNQKEPSSMGITCTLLPGISSFFAEGSYAWYVPLHYEEAVKYVPDLVKPEQEGKKEVLFWKRESEKYSVQVNLVENPDYTEKLSKNLELQVYTKHTFPDGRRVITTVLVNTAVNPENDKVLSNTNMILQPVIRIRGIDGEKIFTSVDQSIHMTRDPELLELEMLYRNSICYAQGHGCSVTWDMNSETPDYIETAFLPLYDLKQMKPRTMEEAELKNVFSMRWLYTAEKSEIIAGIRFYMDCYRAWIGDQKKEAEKMTGVIRDSAFRNLDKCDQALKIILRTIEKLEDNSEDGQKVFHAFRLANEAMFMQRCVSLKKDGKEADPEKITWYPFQLAFIMQEMISFIDPKGTERGRADLLWFPTGGGKTEAYLGIAAFAIFLRRLRDPSDDGVTVIMRYTLRLLTTQQFERASALICACELIRKREKLGVKPITAGLWVGDKAVPNKLDDAESNLKRVQGGERITDKNPCQIKVCPWCGTPIDPVNYKVDRIGKKMLIHCPSKECEFHEGDGLPVNLIDESIYVHLPTFLVATIDKFAQIPLDSRPAALFGMTDHKNPPELIIQDELHLISGPLGTITGAYEVAFEKFCERDGVKAKVIASTATIRNADNQIRALYGRDHTQFPPQGINLKDSFFAVESEPDDKATRRYLGVLGTGTTATTTLIRINAALLFASRYLALLEMDDPVKDSFWTITGYFNSLRELGGAATQIVDDVQSRFSFLANTKFAKKYPGVDGAAQYNHNTELTSRMDNDQLSEIIQKELKWAYPNPDAIDFLLASNMISVGVDVGRLGVMTVAGQPKTNAEYIQATSRVGRSNPGLVITAYNAARSRDRSHYEQFMRYHSSMYRYVEATSLTPFSDRARERALPALFVALVRYLVPGMLQNEAAAKFRKDDPKVAEIKQFIVDYVEAVDPAEKDSVIRELDYLTDEWQEKAFGELVYKSYKEGQKMLLARDTEGDDFSVMNSMRSIECQSGIYLSGGH